MRKMAKCVKCSAKLNQLEKDFSRMLGVEICSKCAGAMNNQLPIEKRLENEIARAELYAVDDDPKAYSYFRGYANGVKWALDQINL